PRASPSSTVWDCLSLARFSSWPAAARGRGRSSFLPPFGGLSGGGGGGAGGPAGGGADGQRQGQDGTEDGDAPHGSGSARGGTGPARFASAARRDYRPDGGSGGEGFLDPGQGGEELVRVGRFGQPQVEPGLGRPPLGVRVGGRG